MNQLSAGLNRRYAVIGSALLIIIWLLVLLRRPYALFYEPWSASSNRLQHISEIQDAFDYPPVDSSAIKSICFDTQWTSDLVFTCDNSVGGIGNIRNSILNCVRYAISAGGSLVVPRIIVRNPENIAHIRTGQRTELEYMFDRKHFVDSLRLSCPELKVYGTVDKIPNHKSAHGPLALLPESLVQDVPSNGLEHPEQWRGTFYKWLGEHFSATSKGPVIVELGRSYLQYPIYTDGEDFALNFGSVLKFRSDVRRLATTALRGMSQNFSLEMDLQEPFIKNAYMGVHLRTEKDAVEGWPAPDWVYSRYSTQSKHYLEQASSSNISILYVASGNTTEVSRFASDAQALNLTITIKSELLQGQDVRELEALTWDQQALVDFLIMLKASDFAGVGHSSFAWNVALKRHVFAAKKDHLDGPQLLSDELSQVYGAPRQYPEYAACLWP